MKIVASAFLVLALTACSKQEPLPAAPPKAGAELAPSSASGAGSLPPDRSTPSGHKAPPTPEAPTQGGANSSPAPDPAAVLEQGEQLFASTCATCHMADGSGVPFLQPPITGSAWLSNPDPQLLLSLILRGSAILGEAAKAFDNDMAPQDHLTDAEIAAVATYVRSRFATPPAAQPVTPAEVAVARKRPGLPK